MRLQQLQLRAAVCNAGWLLSRKCGLVLCCRDLGRLWHACGGPKVPKHHSVHILPRSGTNASPTVSAPVSSASNAASGSNTCGAQH